MATAGDRNPPYQSTGAGGKFRKNQFRRNIKTTPYDRPIIINKIQNPSLLTKIVNPASRLIYAGANKLFGAFRNRLLPSEMNEEPKNVLQVAEKSENSASIAVATGISELEQMLQQKTFTRSEIQRLTALLHSRTTESPSDDVERDGAKLHSSPSPFLRLEASTSGSLKRHGDERDNFHDAISTPAVSSKALENKIASPAELAKAYMGSRPIASSAMRQDMKLLTDASGLPKTPMTSFASKTTTNGFKGLENGFVTPRSRGRSAMYSMARTPYARSSSTSTQKGIGSNYGHGATLTSQSAFGQEGKTAIKRRSSVLDDDIGSGGPLRRTRQKANLLSQRDKRELGYTAFQQSDTTGQKLLLLSGTEPEDLQRAKLNGDAFMHGSGYALVPTKSTQTATKILQHLEKPSPKENNSGSAESPTKLTLDMLHGKALRSLEKVDLPKLLYYPHDSEKSEAPQQAKIHASREPASKGKDKIQENGSRHDRRELTFKGKEKIEENGSSKFPSPCSIFTSVNGEVPVSLKDNAPNVTITRSPSKVPSESPQKKRAFQMSAPDDSFEIDDDEVQVNGHVSFPLVENKKPDTSLVANKLAAADSIESPKLPEVPRTPALVVNNESVSTEVAKIPEPAELKEAENATFSKTNYGLFSEPGKGMKLPPSPPSTTTTQTSALLQSNLQTEKVAPEKGSSPSPFLFGTTVEKVSPFQFSVKEPSVFKPDATLDPKAPESNSVISSVPKNDQVKFSVSNKEDNGNGNDQNSANMLGKSELKSSAVPLAASTNGTFSFGNPTNDASTPNTSSALNAPAFPSTNGAFSFGNPANNASTPNAVSASDAPALASLVPVQASGTNTNSLFSNISPNVTSASTSTPISTTTTTATAATTSFFSTSVSFPVFSFGSTATPTSMAETGNNTNATNDKERRSTTSNLPLITTSFATTTTTTGSGLFGFSSPAVASTTTASSQGSFFSVTNGSQANTSASTAVTQSAPFQFGSGSSSSPFGASTPAFGASATPAFGASATPAFGASAPAFGAPATPAFGTSAPAFGASAPAFGSSTPAFGSSPSFGLMAASSEGKSSNATSVSTTSIFGSTWQAPQSSGSGSTLGSSPSSPVFSFGASSTPMPSTTTSPIVFGASNTAASFMTTGSTNSSFSGPVFGNSAPVFGAATLSPNNNDQMSMEDSMAEDSMHTHSPVSAFGQAPAGAPGFMFGSGTPNPTPAAGSFQFAGQPNQTPPQNPFQSSSVEFNAGGGSFSLGSGGDKSGRRIVRVKNKNRRK